MKDPRASLDRTIRSKLRFIAIERHRDGEPVAQIAASLGLSTGAVYAWIRTGVAQPLSDGTSSDDAKPLAIPAEAGFAHKTALYDMLDSTVPRDYGFDTELWSRFIVGSLLDLKFGIRLDAFAVERLLGSLGFPVDACIRADLATELAGTESWGEAAYRSELKRAKGRQADLLFWHECHVDAVEKALSPLDEDAKSIPEPAYAHNEPRQIAWAVNGRGGFWYCTRTAHQRSSSSLHMLRCMIDARLNPCHVIMANARNASDADLREFAGSTGNRLVLCPSTLPAPHRPVHVASARRKRRTSQ